MDSDTERGGAGAVFPATRCSLIRATTDPDPAIRKGAFEDLISVYWKPVYKYIRHKWRSSNEDAKDLTQAFFVRAMEKDFFERFDPSKARFRTFVRLCVDGFVANEQRAATRLKRGGHDELLALDFQAADVEYGRQLTSVTSDPDDFFHQEWVRGLFALAVEDLRGHCVSANKEIHFALFERYDLENSDGTGGMTYDQLGREFGIPVSSVTNYLAWVRRMFRQFVLERLRSSTGSEEEYRDEVQRLFGRELA